MIKVLLVDDPALFREVLRELLAKAPDLRVAAEAGSYAQAIEMLRTNDINVVVADLSMPGRDGIDLISHIKASNPVVSILVLTMHEDCEYAARALRSGASGYMTKASTSEDLMSGIRRIASGRSFVSPSVSEGLMLRFTRSDSETPPHTTLSHRQFRTFDLLVQCHPPPSTPPTFSLTAKTSTTLKPRL